MRLCRVSNAVVLTLLVTFVSQGQNDFSLTTEQVQAPEMGRVTRCVLKLGSDYYRFAPPRTWQIRVAADKREVTFQPENQTSAISLKFVTTPPSGSTAGGPDSLRNEIRSRFYGLQSLEEFFCYTSGQKGRGFQVNWTAAGQVQMVSRIARFDKPKGYIEFALTASAEHFPKLQPILGALMTSFQMGGGPAAASDG
jgi:hypothetical protein